MVSHALEIEVPQGLHHLVALGRAGGAQVRVGLGVVAAMGPRQPALGCRRGGRRRIQPGLECGGVRQIEAAVCIGGRAGASGAAALEPAHHLLVDDGAPAAAAFGRALQPTYAAGAGAVHRAEGLGQSLPCQHLQGELDALADANLFWQGLDGGKGLAVSVT